MSRVIKVARMQLINKWTFLGIPMVILAGGQSPSRSPSGR